MTARNQTLLQQRTEAAHLLAQGYSQARLARHLGVSRQCASRWFAAWQDGGADALQTIRQPGPRARLTQQQREQIATELLKGPEAHGYATPLWTLERIGELIERQTGVGYHPGHVWHLMRGMNWSCHKPERRAKERDEDAIARWLDEEWPALKRGHKSEEPRSPSWTRPASPCALASQGPGRPRDRRR